MEPEGSEVFGVRGGRVRGSRRGGACVRELPKRMPETAGRPAGRYLRGAFFFPATVFFRPFRVRAFVFVRWPRTGRLRRCRSPR